MWRTLLSSAFLFLSPPPPPPAPPPFPSPGSHTERRNGSSVGDPARIAAQYQVTHTHYSLTHSHTHSHTHSRGRGFDVRHCWCGTRSLPAAMAGRREAALAGRRGLIPLARTAELLHEDLRDKDGTACGDAGLVWWRMRPVGRWDALFIGACALQNKSSQLVFCFSTFFSRALTTFFSNARAFSLLRTYEFCILTSFFILSAYSCSCTQCE